MEWCVPNCCGNLKALLETDTSVMVATVHWITRINCNQLGFAKFKRFAPPAFVVGTNWSSGTYQHWRGSFRRRFLSSQVTECLPLIHTMHHA
eukprot:c3634_g1_i2 orf=136-411(+)